MTPLILIRHAPTAWNARGLIQGRTDVPLGAAGRQRAAAWRPPAEAVDCDWLSSPLARARATAEVMAGRTVPVDDRLAEMSWGAWEGRRLADLRAELGHGMSGLEALGLDFRPPGGESPRDVQSRLRPLLAELAARRRTTLAVTHKGVIRAVYAAATGWDMTGKPPHRLRSEAAQVFLLDAAGAPRIARLNQGLAAP